MTTPNVSVDYVDAETGAPVDRAQFYDPGLDENSWLAREQRAAGKWSGPHLSYGCGSPVVITERGRG